MELLMLIINPRERSNKGINTYDNVVIITEKWEVLIPLKRKWSIKFKVNQVRLGKWAITWKDLWKWKVGLSYTIKVSFSF
jgi:hypothetical protein